MQFVFMIADPRVNHAKVHVNRDIYFEKAR